MKRTNKSRAPARRPSTQRRPVSTGTGMGAKLLIMAAVVAAVVFGVADFLQGRARRGAGKYNLLIGENHGGLRP